MSDFKLGNIEFYLGLAPTGNTLTVSGDHLATDTSIDVTGADLADVTKGDHLYLVKPAGINEYLFVKSEATGTLTVKRDRFKTGALAIPNGTVLTEMKFVKRKIAPEALEVSAEVLVNPVRVETHDGVETILFDVEKEEPKISVTFLSEADLNYIKTQCPIVDETVTTDSDEDVIITGSVDDYEVNDHTIPALLAFKNVPYNDYHRIFPKLTLLSIPAESYQNGEVFTQKVELAALKQTLGTEHIVNGKDTCYYWTVKKKAV